jgi:hypothetical protein
VQRGCREKLQALPLLKLKLDDIVDVAKPTVT